MSCAVTSCIIPRTTLDLDSSILYELRQRGQRQGKSMGDVASELLARALAEGDSTEPDPPFRWISRSMGRPLVDLEDKEAVRRILDAP